MLQHVGENAPRSRPSTAICRPPASARSSAGWWRSRSRAATSSSANPCSISKTCCRPTRNGNGVVNILAADKLINAPRLYSTFLLWMLSELFEHLPEVGDVDKPRLVFFFDEAHLLFDDAPRPLLQKIEQVVRLIRSKGVGVFFVTQNPLDIPDTVLGQLGNRVQHALRAYTPRDQKAVKAAAETFRPNPELDVVQVISEMGVGEALVSFLDDKGRPEPVQRAFILPPSVADRADHARGAAGGAGRLAGGRRL
jgi:DNA helicase HerA-like ATPase